MVEGEFTSKGETFKYKVVQWIKRDEYTPHDQKMRKRISPDQLGEAEAIYVKVEGGSVPAGEEEYRYLWGPFPGEYEEIEQHLSDAYEYDY